MAGDEHICTYREPTAATFRKHSTSNRGSNDLFLVKIGVKRTTAISSDDERQKSGNESSNRDIQCRAKQVT